ncbi:MAG: hypothetical protein ACK4QL_07235 [Pseudanabaenaceae cyanobacterium]
MERVKDETDELTIYKKLYRQAQEQIQELQEELALSKTVISHQQELSSIQAQRIQELEQELAETNDRLKSEQERSAQFRSALRRCQENQEVRLDSGAEVNNPPGIESWAVKEVASVPPIADPRPESKASVPNKRPIDSLAAVKLPQFPPLRRR